MSRLEFVGWQIQYRKNPWGNEWDQARAVAAAAVAPWSKGKVKLEKFFPRSKRQSMTDEQILASKRAWERQRPGMFTDGG